MPKQVINDDAFRDPLNDFTGREIVLDLFNRYLHSEQGSDYILAIKGNSGAGKTFLTDYLSRRVCPRLVPAWHTVVLSFSHSETPDFQNILTTLENGLEDIVAYDALQHYQAEYKEFVRTFAEYKNATTVKIDVKADNQSIISDVTAASQVYAQLHERRLQLRTDLSNAFINFARTRQQPLCLFIDEYERLRESNSELVAWLFRAILHRMSKAYPLRIVTCGWEWPIAIAVEPFRVQQVELEDFDLEELKNYLEKRNLVSPTTDIPMQTELISAFYELTKGHPLVLSLAVEYFIGLPDEERLPQSLRSSRPLIDEQARVAFLQERLIDRLDEPYRTLVERGPILRSFDQPALQALLNIETDGTSEIRMLDDRSYERFLRYPFITSKKMPGSDLQPGQATFHDLVRRVQIEALRTTHPRTKKLLHLSMAQFYENIINAELKRQTAQSAGSSKDEYADLFVGTPEREFQAWLEFFYHGLQAEEIQEHIFETWERLLGEAEKRNQLQQVKGFLELIRQLSEEGEPFFNKTTSAYQLFLMYYISLVMGKQEEAIVLLEDAAQAAEHVGQVGRSSGYFEFIGSLYGFQGRMDKALRYFKHSIALLEQRGNASSIALILNNISYFYSKQGKLDEALHYAKRALALSKQTGYSAETSHVLRNLGNILVSQGELVEALNHYERALGLEEQGGNEDQIAFTLNNMGFIYRKQGKFDEALHFHERALALLQNGRVTDIASTLNAIATVYKEQEKWEEAIVVLDKSLRLYERLGQGFESKVADQLEKLLYCYGGLGEFEKGVPYYRRLRQLRPPTEKTRRDENRP